LPRPIRVTGGVLIPAAALSVKATRSSGPGGQNVNKVASKIELRVDLAQVRGLPDDARARLEAMTAARRDAAGRLRVTSQRTRDQGRNLEDAVGKVRALIERSLVRPRTRRPTRPGARARERRLAEKKRSAELKRRRGRVRLDGD
jgi:ribosome-associated protein